MWAPRVIAGGLLLVGVLAAALALRKRQPLVSLSLLWFVVTLVPVSNVLPIGNWMAERFLYAPSVGFCMLVSSVVLMGAEGRPRLWPAAVAGLVCVGLGWAVLTVDKNRDWDDGLRFWKAATVANPRSAQAHTSLGMQYLAHNLPRKTIREEEDSSRLQSPGPVDLLSLGQAWRDLGDTAKAESFFAQAVRHEETAYTAHLNLAMISYGRSLWKSAAEHMEAALRINPADSEVRAALGECYVRLLRYSDAIRELTTALQASPGLPRGLYWLGRAYAATGKRELAIACLDRLLQGEPSSPFAGRARELAERLRKQAE
jgi:tetratricopeptide (TPR) repeat protein